MDVQYIDEQELNPVNIDDGYYSVPEKSKPQFVVQRKITLQDYQRIAKNTFRPKRG
ncbi:hypothetical protein Plhal304r1_c064g0151351 [Plasmopara halstedii]